VTPERKQRIESVLNNRQADITLILENVNDPHNVSAVMRTADAIGVSEIFVLNNRIPLFEKWGKKSSSSAAKWLQVHQFDDTETCIKAVRARYDKIYTTHLSADAKGLWSLNLTERVALVFGNEHAGITEELLTHSDGNFIIPQVGMIQSLNISVACAICLYEAMRQRDLAGFYKESRLDEQAKQALINFWNVQDDFE
jgi:tRNA (guanosine-2'-O-)-methyltransferase